MHFNYCRITKLNIINVIFTITDANNLLILYKRYLMSRINVRTTIYAHNYYGSRYNLLMEKHTAYSRISRLC